MSPAVGFLVLALSLSHLVWKQYHLSLSYSCGRFRLKQACQVSTMSVVSCIKALPASSLITWLVISPGPCQIRNYLNPVTLMHLHDTLAGTGWNRAVCHFYASKMHMLVTRGLPVLDYTARSCSELSEEAYITVANHMIWDLSGYFAQRQHCGLKCSNPEQVHSLLWVFFFNSGLIQWPSFQHLSKIRPCVWYCLSDRGLFSGWWKSCIVLSK